MIEKLKDEDFLFYESLCDPVVFSEVMFSDLGNLVLFDVETFSRIRTGQVPYLSYDYMLLYDSNLKPEENFALKHGSGTVYNFGARLTGKTLCEKLDIFQNCVMDPVNDTAFSSFDDKHIDNVLNDVARVLETHPFFKPFEADIKRNPYRITFEKGWKLEAVNMNLQGSDPGSAWFGKHVKRMWIEEFSAESEKVEEKRHDAVSEMGCVYKFSGMTNFTKYKPAGKIYYDLDKRPFLVNLPSMTNPTWNARKKAEKIKEYGGEESINYKIYVLGEVIEDGLSAIDIDRVRENYSKDKQIKHIEITKDKFPIFQHFLICERPKKCDALYIAGDIGENITEMIVISEYEKKFKYLYNITLHNLIDKEQYRIFKFLGELLKANYIALDTTDGQGRSIYHSLQEDFPEENLCSVAFNEKIAVDFLKNEEGVVQFEDGKPLYREEWIMEWAMKRLRDILYELGRIEIPWDTNLDIQLNSVIATYSKLGNRVLYKCCHTEDHLYAAWLVWFISQWTNEFMNAKPITKKTFSKFGA
jgi:hypothetical protein